MRILCVLTVLVILSISAYSQEYIVFEEQQSINNKEFLPKLKLSFNRVELAQGDTSVTLYNWFFSPQPSFKWESLSPQLDALSPSLLNDLIIVAVPLVNTSQKEIYQKLSSQELQQLNVVPIDTLLKRTLLDLNKHVSPRTANMPPLKTLQYKLVIKKNECFYLVNSPVLVEQFVVSHETIYFPNEFKNGMLAINPNNATYNFKTIDSIEKEFLKKELPRKWLNKIYNRIYLSNIEHSSPFNKPVFSFWEYPSDDVVSSLLNLKTLHEFNLGLGSFQYIDGIGIVNATLDTFIKHKILYQQKPYLKVKRINGVSLNEYVSKLNKKDN